MAVLRRSSLTLALLGLSVAALAGHTPYVVHDVHGAAWKANSAAGADEEVFAVLVAGSLALGTLESECQAVSDPTSSTYGQYWTIAQVKAQFSNEEAAAAVEHSLTHTYNALEVRRLGTGEHVAVRLRAEDAARLFGTEFHVFEEQLLHCGVGQDCPPPRRLLRTARLTPHALPAELAPLVRSVYGVSDMLVAPRPRMGAASASSAVAATATATATATAPTAPTAAATDTMSPEITSATAPPQLTASMAASYPLVKLKFHQPCQDGVSSSSTPPCSDAAGPTIEQYDMVLKYTVATSPVSVTQTTCTVQASQVSADGTEYSVGCDISGLDVGSNGKLGRVTLVSFTATDTSGVSHSSVSDNVYHNLEGFDLLVSPVLKVEDALSLYGVPSDTPERASRQKDASQGVVSFMGQYISGSDLSDYLTDMGVTKSGMVGVRGPNDPNNPGDEATLDVQWLVGTSPAVNTLVWSMSDPSGSASLEVLFERHAYMLGWATAAAASDCAPDVSSISYGAAESAISSTSATYLDDANSELLKLCLRGKTVLASSGDNGADGDNESSYYLADCSLSPSFPASSPWVTAVSATVVSSPALTPECSARPSSSTVQTQFGSEQDLCELAVSLKTGVFWTTGGGVSEYTAQPWFQAGAVQEYTTRTGVATNGKRVYPDVSAVGHQFRTVLGGQRNTVDGTSASSPLFAAMLSLINAHRLANGRPRLGFVNPALYSLYASTPSLFYDVQVGENTCSAYGSEYCCDKGYTAVQGFDAVTGLGSIADWDALRQALTTMGPQTSSPSPEPAPDSCFGTPPGSPSGGGSDSWVYYVAVAALVALLIAVAFYVRSLHRRSRRQGAQPRQRPAGPPLAQQQHVYIVPNGQQVYMPAVYAQPQPGAQTVYPGAQPGSYVRMG